MMIRGNQQKGFSLMELMITIVVIGIISAIAFPSYQSSVRKSRRVEAKTALLDIMARQEKYFSEKRSYSSTLDGLGIGSTGSGMKTENGYYQITMTVDTSTNSVTVVADANENQIKDEVRQYSISSDGRKSWLSSITKSEEPGWE